VLRHVYSADYRMVKMLLSRGAQVNEVDVVGNTPLHTATIYGHTELVKLLLQHSAEVYKKGQHGALAIHMAAHEGHANLVRLFCQFAEVCLPAGIVFSVSVCLCVCQQTKSGSEDMT